MGSGHSKRNAVLVGMCSSGAGTYMRSFKGWEGVKQIMVTIGHLYQTVELEKMKLTYWLIGGSDKLTQLNEPYLKECDCLILFFNSCQDEAVTQRIKNDFYKLLAQLNREDVPVLVAITKLDLPSSRSQEEIEEALELKTKMNPQTPYSVLSLNTSQQEDRDKITQWIENCHTLLPPNSQSHKSAAK